MVTRSPSTATLRRPETPDASSRSRLNFAPSWKTTVLRSNWSGSLLTPLVIRAEICGLENPADS